MPATQISFLAFAHAAHQQAAVCTPPVIQAPAALVVQPDVADGGECIQPHADYAEFDRLCALADATFVVPLADTWSSGGYVLAALANCVAPRSGGCRSQSELVASLRYHAERCIGAGC